MARIYTEACKVIFEALCTVGVEHWGFVIVDIGCSYELVHDVILLLGRFESTVEVGVVYDTSLVGIITLVVVIATVVVVVAFATSSLTTLVLF